MFVVAVAAPVLSIFAVAYGLNLQQAFGDTAAQAAGACGLAQPAFCDTLTSGPQGSGRTGQLDPNRWSVTRLTSDINPSQGVVNQFYPASLPMCDQNVGAIVPDKDVAVCPLESYFDESFDDGGNFVYNAFRPRLAFDFANRSGTIVFDADAKTAGSHTWWLELWITDQPVPAPTWSTIGVWAHPRNAIGVDFSGCGIAGANTTIGGVQFVHLANNYNITDAFIANGANSNCYSTADGVRNHFEIHLSQQRLEVWATDAGGANLRMVASQDNLNLPFTRGYVNFEHVQYNAPKESVSGQQHYEWTNLGFDGPVLSTPRAYDVPDALGSRGSNVNLGYDLAGGIQSGTMRSCCSTGGFSTVAPFTLRGVDKTGATGAELNLNVANYNPSSQLSYRLNGGAWRQVAYPFPDTNAAWRAVSSTVALSDLMAGDNTLELAAANEVQVSNIDMTVETSAGTAPPPPATSTPVPANTATPAPVTSTPVPPTNMPAPVTSTPVPPTNMPAPVTSTPVPPSTPAPVNTAVPPTSTAVPAPAAGPLLTTSARTSSGQINPGGNVTITASVKSDRSASIMVDVEVFDPAGARVLHNTYDGQTFGAGQTHTYASTFQVPMTAQGTYTVKIGGMTQDGGSMFYWNDHAGTYRVV